VIIDGDNPADPAAGRQPGGQGMAHPPGCPRHGHDWPGAISFRNIGHNLARRVSFGAVRGLADALPTANLALSVAHDLSLPG
jgi:hypothetical protein